MNGYSCVHAARLRSYASYNRLLTAVLIVDTGCLAPALACTPSTPGDAVTLQQVARFQH